VNDERPLEDELLELIGHRLRRNLINIIDLANLELTANSTEQSDLMASLTRMKGEALQTLSTVDALLSLAQGDPTPVPCEPFDLAALVRQLAPELQRQVADAGTTLTIDVPVSSLKVMGSVEHLQKMLPLLLEFALWQGKPDSLHLKIAPDATTISLSLQSDSPIGTSNATSSESMPLANLLSLWAQVRGMNACGGALCYGRSAFNFWTLTTGLPFSN